MSRSGKEGATWETADLGEGEGMVCLGSGGRQGRVSGVFHCREGQTDT